MALDMDLQGEMHEWLNYTARVYDRYLGIARRIAKDMRLSFPGVYVRKPEGNHIPQPGDTLIIFTGLDLFEIAYRFPVRRAILQSTRTIFLLEPDRPEFTVFLNDAGMHTAAKGNDAPTHEGIDVRSIMKARVALIDYLS